MDGVFEGFRKREAGVFVAVSEFVTGFAEEDNIFDLRSSEGFVELGEVFVVGFVATADDDSDFVIWEGIDGDAGRGWVGSEVVVVDFDAIIFTEEFEAVGETVEGAKAFNNGRFVFS